jgi:hypothetical protein
MFENNELNVLDVLVYCGGKCGTSTLLNTCLNNDLKCYSVHNNKYFEYVCNRTNKDVNKTIYDVIDFNVKQNKKLYIIDSYRTPIERKISSLFQNIDLHIYDYKNKSIHNIINLFNNKLLYNIENYHPIDEVMLHYGLDIFTDFDFENKYSIKEKDNLVFVKIRFNDINEWSEILSKIFNKKIEIFSNNLTETKDVYNLYKEFKEKYSVPEHFLNNYVIPDSKFNIYNTEDEKIKYIEYWKNK